MSRFTPIALLTTIAVASGCAGPATFLERPTTAEMLANDGSPAQQQALRERYGLTTVTQSSWAGEQFGVRNVGGSDVVPLLDRNVAETLATSAAAADAIDNWSFGFASTGSSTRVNFMVLGALVGMVTGYYVGGGIDVTATDNTYTLEATNMGVGAMLGLIGSVAVIAAGDMFAQGQARVSTMQAVNAYNRELDQKIAAGATGDAPATPATPATPPAPITETPTATPSAP